MRKVPRIGIDCRFAHTHSGLGRYTRELVLHLLKRNDPFEYVLFVHSLDDEWLRTLKDLSTPYSLLPTPFSHYSLLEQLLFPRIIKKASLDLFFSPHFNVPLLCPVPFVVTIHDLILHRYPNQVSLFKQWMYRCVIGHAVKRARSIIAVSVFTKNELQKSYGESAVSKTTVIHEGVDDSFSPRSHAEQEEACSRYGIPTPFFLYVGNAKEHKNVQMLIDAFIQADVDGSLVLVTGGKELKRLRIPSCVIPSAPHPRMYGSSELTMTCEGAGCIEGGHRSVPIHIITDIHDEDLPVLYSAAQCFVTASLYEGFCLPAVEAIACGCPVIALKCAAIPEVIGTHGALIEPQLDTLVHALHTPPQRVSVCRLYDWNKTAELTAEALKSVLCAVPCYH